MCFDTESSAFYPWRYGFQSPEVVRGYFEDRTVRFDCGIIYDAASKRYHEFLSGREHAGLMVDMLSRADELVTFNRTRFDFIVLETQVGRERIDSTLRRIPHHDVSGWRGVFELRALAGRVLQPDAVTILDDLKPHRDRYLASGLSDFLSEKLAKCRCDVELTYAAFEQCPDLHASCCRGSRVT